MKTYRLKDTSVINLDFVQSIGPIQNDGYNNYEFRIYMNNHWLVPNFKTRNGAIEQRDALILELEQYEHRKAI